MATTAQILANQKNSKLSTGPRTDEGKAASSANATTHGFNAVDPVLPHEDRAEFNLLLEQHKSDFDPATAHEEFLVFQIVGAQWKLNRLQRIEVAMFAALESPGDPVTTDAMMVQGRSRTRTPPPASRGSIAIVPAWSAPINAVPGNCAPRENSKSKPIPPNLLKRSSQSS